MRRDEAERVVKTHNKHYEKRNRKLHVINQRPRHRVGQPLEENCAICETLSGEPTHVYHSRREVLDDIKLHNEMSKARKEGQTPEHWW